MKKDWYPKVFNDLKNYNPLESDYIDICRYQIKKYNHNKIITALVPTEIIPQLKGDSLSFNIDASGPYTMPHEKNEDYIPRFWVQTSIEDIELEPLVISWDSCNNFFYYPDQGFLMSYGLMPRFMPNSQEIHWDELQAPDKEVIIMKPKSNYEWGNANELYIKVKKDYISDYSTLRNKSVIQIYWTDLLIKEDEELELLLNDSQYKKFEFEDRVIELKRQNYEYKYHIQISGYRILYNPGNSPITSGRWNYEELLWPGFENPITKDIAMRSRLTDCVYVKDSVLAKFEGQEGFVIHPESGGLDYAPQWGVGYCWRIGRNLIKLELKKLYEGTRPEIVKHYHQYAVKPPNIDIDEKNIAQLSKELLDSYLLFGEYFSQFISSLINDEVSCLDLINLSRKDLEYNGWWSFESLEPLGRHVPENLNKEQFLNRCSNLDKLLSENLNEKKLRQFLVKIGVPKDVISTFKSISLLRLVIEVIIVSKSSGLEISNQFYEIYDRINLDKLNSKVDLLFALNEFRQLASHNIGAKYNERFNRAIETFEIDSEIIKSGYFNIIFFVYDKIIQSIQEIVEIIPDQLQDIS